MPEAAKQRATGVRRCRACGCRDMRVVKTIYVESCDVVKRVRRCRYCGARNVTVEREIFDKG